MHSCFPTPILTHTAPLFPLLLPAVPMAVFKAVRSLHNRSGLRQGATVTRFSLVHVNSLSHGVSRVPPSGVCIKGGGCFRPGNKGWPCNPTPSFVGPSRTEAIYITSGSFPVPVCSLELNEVTGFLARLFDFVGHWTNPQKSALKNNTYYGN